MDGAEQFCLLLRVAYFKTLSVVLYIASNVMISEISNNNK